MQDITDANNNIARIICTVLVVAVTIAIAVGIVVFDNLNSRQASQGSGSGSTNQNSSQSDNSSTTATSTPSEAPVSAPSSLKDKTISSSELTTSNGKSGKPCYIAVDGIVYVISGIAQWVDGLHTTSGDKARCGKDLSEVIKQSPHGRRVLSLLTKVGVYQQ